MITWLTAVVITVVVAAVLLSGAWAFQTANRLDRLHVRYDLSWQALDGALARRAVVARAVAVDAYGGGAGRPGGWPRWPVPPNGHRGRAARPPRTNCRARWLWWTLRRCRVALVAELADAEARVLLARRFHNDAVRDTLALRERPRCALLRLGGTAALPTYFEIAEGGECRRGRPSPLRRRTSARVVLLDGDGAVLLLCGSDPAVSRQAPRRRPDGGSPSAARPRRGSRWRRPRCGNWRRRPGLRVAPADIVGPVWRRDAVIDFNGSVMRSEEMYFVHRTARFEPSESGRTGLERAYIHGHRWCDATMIGELVANGETVYPLQLGELARRSERAGRRSRRAVPRRPLQSIR